jgi:hypothetical protein
LLWTGPADLDLRVEDPAGHQLSFILRECAGGGVLDVDCNSSPQEICKRPIENIYWPPGRAPEGVYRAPVVFFNPHQGVTSADYSLQVLLGEVVVGQTVGTVSKKETGSEVVDHRFVRNGPGGPRGGRGAELRFHPHDDRPLVLSRDSRELAAVLE